MARASLERKLKQIQKQIEKSSTVYRDLISDKKVHTLIIDEKEIEKEAIKQLTILFGVSEKDPLILEEFIPLFKKTVPRMCRQFLMLSEKFLNRKGSNIILSNLTKTGTNSFSVVIGFEKGKTADIFKFIRKYIKQPAQKMFLYSVQGKINRLNKGRDKKHQLKAAYNPRGGISFFDIGHSSETAVSVQRKNIAENELVKWSTKQSPGAQKILKALLSELKWSISQKDIKATQELTVSLESGLENKYRGSVEEKKLAEQLERDLSALLEKSLRGSDTWPADLEGSDSYNTKTEKRLLNNFTNDKFRSKNITSNIKKQKVKSSTSVGTLKVKRKASFAKGADKVYNSGGAVLKRSKKQKTENLFSIMALINQKLPDQVRKNMGSPRLENVSGRFASSVKLTSVTTTRRGFPSFGYTYQRNPYQVYEDGAEGREPWANTERDPRQLIDASIREIAAEMAIGRFYTRRE